MTVESTSLPEVLLLTLDSYRDERGAFMELWRSSAYEDAGIPDHFVQDNLSVSRKNVLRGLHFQYPKGQAKLVSIVQGRVFDVVVDIRRGSPRFGQWTGVELRSDRPQQLFIPEGFAHGFVSLEERTCFHYKCSSLYAPECEHSIRWDDAEIGISWPVQSPIISEKDAAAPYLVELDDDSLPAYKHA